MERAENVTEGTGIRCDICGNNWGERCVDVRLEGPVQFIYACLVCSNGKTDFEIFKIVYPKKFKQH
jgi:hypothetical protein